ncbi:hypothetical protein HNY73_002116 [Argiope bruennichi]|uniref:Transposase n=1 Tax=Argiope bruennichi TaxID=94029 RepID=A0A8T0FSM6_ARGBR|nr:hypothetical protein HNY73_002116 [Argiope bruennichi]
MFGAEKTVYNWFSEFLRGLASVSDESREGRPKSVVIPRNVDAVRKMIEEDRHVMYREIKQNEPNPTKVARLRSTSKKIVACFFGLIGHIATIPLKDRKNVNPKWYAEICLPKVINEIRKNNKNRRIILHHENTSCYTTCETIDYLKDKNFELMPHCPYSPALSSNDFFLFHYVKQKMREQRFSSPQETVDACFQNHVSKISTSEWKSFFKNRFELME